MDINYMDMIYYHYPTNSNHYRPTHSRGENEFRYENGENEFPKKKTWVIPSI